jgi:hypothetical protein
MGLGRDGEPGITAVLVIDAFGAECVTEALPYDATDAEGADGPDGERVSGEADGGEGRARPPPVRFGQVHGGGTEAALQYARLLLAFATPVRVKVLLATADGLLDANPVNAAGDDTSQSLRAVRSTLDSPPAHLYVERRKP